MIRPKVWGIREILGCEQHMHKQIVLLHNIIRHVYLKLTVNVIIFKEMTSSEFMHVFATFKERLTPHSKTKQASYAAVATYPFLSLSLMLGV